ncbi:anti-sigma-I factor RsgI family protein [Oscillibacter ruminantium]
MAEYTDMQLESLLSAAIDRSVPDLREEAASAPVSLLSAPDGIVSVQTSRRSSALRRTVMGLAACLVLMLGLSSFAFFRPLSVIGIDVNPSIELTANYFDKVLSVKPLNEDAVTIIGDMDLKYVNLDIAMNALVASMALHGYFESGQDVAVLVSVSSGSESHNLTLQKKLAVDIKAAASAVGAKASVYTQNIDKTSVAPPTPPASSSPGLTPPVTPSHTLSPAPETPSPVTPTRPATAQERAAQNGISYGKQVFIDKLLTLDPTLSESELAVMPIGKIASLVKQRGLDLSSIVDDDSDDSVKENIEDFIADLDTPDDDDDDGKENNDDKKGNNGNHNGWDEDDDEDDD